MTRELPAKIAEAECALCKRRGIWVFISCDTLETGETLWRAKCVAFRPGPEGMVTCEQPIRWSQRYRAMAGEASMTERATTRWHISDSAALRGWANKHGLTSSVIVARKGPGGDDVAVAFVNRPAEGDSSARLITLAPELLEWAGRYSYETGHSAECPAVDYDDRNCNCGFWVLQQLIVTAGGRQA